MFFLITSWKLNFLNAKFLRFIYHPLSPSNRVQSMTAKSERMCLHIVKCQIDFPYIMLHTLSPFSCCFCAVSTSERSQSGIEVLDTVWALRWSPQTQETPRQV